MAVESIYKTKTGRCHIIGTRLYPCHFVRSDIGSSYVTVQKLITTLEKIDKTT